jgi:hypothetical protein
MKTRYLHLDCEMGGRDLKYSLLTAYFMVTEADGKFVKDLRLYVKPDDGVYIVCGQGMRVNRINLAEHDEMAMTYKEAKPELYGFLNSVTDTPNGKFRLTPVGHGVKGDIEFVLKYLISTGSWEKFCSFHYLDTSVVLQFIRACGMMPEGEDGSVGALAKQLGIPVNGELHDEKVDTQTTAAILEKFVGMVKK